MAKIISQETLFDYSEIEELGDLERLDLAMDGIDDERLMRKLEAKRKNGRDDYPVRVMWNLVIAMIVFCLKKMTLMVALSMIIMNGMAVGKIKNGKKNIRSLKNAA